MQTLIVTLVLSLVLYSTGTAQTSYNQEIGRAFELWQSSQPDEAANLFEKIATTEEGNWLPYYYAAQVKIVQSFPMNNAAQKQQLLTEAQYLLDKAKNLDGDEVELMILQAMLHTATLTIDPGMYGMKLSPVITGLYAQASQKEPDNPRLFLSKTEWKIGSAQYFGEDPSMYCKDLKENLPLFEKEVHLATVAPAWGEERLKSLISQTCGE